ncbi:MAG: Spy/CpxP family protein refolding chaperone [Proteobacteria bacterium]|nr:Spy/CpxP family protein refolding chaperone [Pseudomonadota bacterium]
MSRPWMGYLAGAAFVLSTVGAATAYAQGGAKAAQDQAAADSHAGHEARIERHGGGDGRDHDMRYERRIVMRHGEDAAEHLRTMLQLKPGQEAALQAYVAAIHPARHGEHVIEMSDHAAARTTTQKLADMEQRLAEQTTQARARIEATRRFYDQLEPSQKKVFDELPLPGPMMIMPGMGPMRVMVNMDGLPHMDHMPPPPLPPAPPAPPAPPRLDD